MSETRAQRIAEALFQVQPAELRKTALMFLYLLLGMSAFIIGRTTKDTLFLSYYKVSFLPQMMIAVAVVAAAIAAAYSRIVDRFRRDRLIFGIDLILAAAMVVAYYLVYCQVKHDAAHFKPGDWIFPAFYILIEGMGILVVVTFWTFANDLFTSREAKRLFSIIGAGGVLANVTSSAITTWLIKVVGFTTIDLIMLVAACLIAGALIIRALGSGTTFNVRPPPVQRAGAAKANIVTDIRDVAASKHLRYIAMIVVVMSLAIQFVDYQYKLMLKQNFHGDQMTVFQSWFVGATGVFGCLMQFFVTGRLIERFGIMVALLFLPLGMGSGLVYFIPTVALAGAVIAEGSNYVFRYTINDSTMQLLYIPVNPAKRGRAKAFIDGMLKQIANGTTGVVVLILNMVHVPLNRIAVIPAVLVGLWLFLLTRVKREYLKSLMATLKKSSFDLASTAIGANDEATANLLQGILTGPGESPEHVLHALDLTPHITSRNWAPVLTGLLQHADPRVRNKALESLGNFGWSIDIKEMMRCLQDPDEQVRATAIMAYCQVLKERAVSGVKGFLRDPSPRIRAAAVSGLIRHCGLDGILEAADILKRMIENHDEGERFWGAATMRQIAVSNFYHTLFRLLGDPSQAVQKEAIAAAGEMRSRELIPALIYKLGSKGTASAAAAALVKYGDEVLDTMGKVLINPGEKREIRLRIPRIVSEINTQKAIDTLVKCIGEPDGVLRQRIVASIAKLRRANAGFGLDGNVVLAQMKADIRRAYQDAVIVRDLGFKGTGWNVLREALEIRFKRHVSTALRLVECLYPRSQMNLIIANLSSETVSVRANAIEAIDNMVSRVIGRQIIPLIESGDPASHEAMLDEVGEIRSMERAQWLEELLRSPDHWIVVSTLSEIKTHGPATLLPMISSVVRSHDPVVRETALYCMLSSGVTLVDPSALADLAHDRSPLVAAFAKDLLRQSPVPGTEVTP